MPGRLQGKVALITGSGRGIGRAIALKFAEEGAAVIINSTTPETCKRVAEEVREINNNCIAITADVSKRSEVERLRDEALSSMGKIDILVNNAGINIPNPAIEITEEEWDRTMDVNLKGVFLCCQAFGREMIKQRSGNIINVSSVAGLRGRENRLSYCVSKAGVNILTQVLAVEWARYGVRVNAIAPGTIRTDRVTEFMRRGLYREEDVLKRTPLGFIGSPSDVASVAVFLASQESSFITGATVVVDGGWTAFLP